MDRVEILKKAVTNYSVKFLEFMKIKSNQDDLLVCVFEGEDEKYYSARIVNRLGGIDWTGINAGGKHEVLKLYEAVSQHPDYKSSNFLCFIDKDFEDWFENPDSDRIYVTPCYSIENLFVSTAVLKRILSAEFGVTEYGDHQEDFCKVLALFQENGSLFAEEIHQIMCWIKAHRIMKRDCKTTPNINVRNIKTDSIISIGLGQVQRNYDPNDINSVFKEMDGHHLCSEAISEATDSLKTVTWELVYRGKQVADFMRCFLNKLKQDKTSRTPALFAVKGNVKLSLSKENIISELSQYADTPDCLNSFLDNYKNKAA